MRQGPKAPSLRASLFRATLLLVCAGLLQVTSFAQEAARISAQAVIEKDDEAFEELKAQIPAVLELKRIQLDRDKAAMLEVVVESIVNTAGKILVAGLL